MPRRRRRGASLIETLLAMAIMALLVVGILQMFVVSLGVTKNSAARTQLVYKAQQLAEVLRWMQYQHTNYGGQIPSGTGIPVPFGASQLGNTYDIPTTQSDSRWAFWGPQGMNILEGDNPPYKLTYEIVNNDTAAQAPVVQPGTWGVIVTAVPIQVSNPGDAGSYVYQGSGVLQRKVQYVTNVKK